MKPSRLPRTIPGGTYFITTSTWQKRRIFQVDQWARIFLMVLTSYRRQGIYQLHEFVLMPNHFHILITPALSVTLEKSVQLIKGRSSYMVQKERQAHGPVWQRGFTDRRVRDVEEYRSFVRYINENPVKEHLAASPEEFPFCSAFPGYKLDPPPDYLRG